jgi:hypothetical protein
MNLRAEIELAKARELDQNEAAIAQCFPPPPALSDEAKQRLQPFLQWCETQRVRPLPAKPASVAAFVHWQQDQHVPRQIIVETLASIEAVHIAASVGNPVVAPVVATTLGSTVPPPRSWTKEDKAFFTTLPLHAQEIIANREQARETHLRRTQNEFAEMKKRLNGGADKSVTTSNEGIDTMAKKKPGEGAYHNNDGDPIERRETDPGTSVNPKGKDIFRKVFENGDRTSGFSAKLDNE